MKQTFRKKLLVSLIAGLALPVAAQAAEADLLKKLEALAKEVEMLRAQVKASEEKVNSMAAKSDAAAVADLKGKVDRLENKSLSKWLTVGGDYHFRADSLRGEVIDHVGITGFNPATGAPIMAPITNYKPKNSSLFTNRFGLDLDAKATRDVSVSARLAMYKVFGSQSDATLTNAGAAPFFADRVGVFDGTVSHVPSDSRLNVDRVYATWSNIADQDMWFSVGRRPSTGGAPNNIRTNGDRPGKGGTPALLVDYAFDGMTLGYAPDIDALPGAYAKLCYGVGFDSGFTRSGNSIKDTTMLGVAIVPIDTDPLRVWMQWNRGMQIFDNPVMSNTFFGNTRPTTNLGDIDWFGIGAMSTFKNVGSGDLHVFADWGLSRTKPNNNLTQGMPFGLLTGSLVTGSEAANNKTGTAIALGMRYDLPTKTKLGLEFNRGSKNWITFAPAANDMFTSKYGTRGDVWEAYVIQELDRMPISSHASRAFFRLGMQHYNFKYTGSNNWVGAPVAMSDVTGATPLVMAPLKNATDIYATFEVKF